MTTQYKWGGKWLDAEGFKEVFGRLGIRDMTDLTCESAAYTRQMLELCTSLEAKADILYVETRKV